MRKVIYGGAVSLDGFLAGPRGSLDWLRWSDDAAQASLASWAGVDTVLLGRKTYEHALRTHGTLGVPKGIAAYVFSRTLQDVLPDVSLVRENPVEYVGKLRSSHGGNIIVMGGGELGTALLEAGLVDEIGFNLHPVLLGSGIPAIRPMRQRLSLHLLEARQIAHGCVLIRFGTDG